MRTEPDQELQKALTKRILIFLGVTFALTYFLEIAGLYPMFRQLEQNPEIATSFSSLMSLVMFLPAIGVVITRVITKEGFRGGNLFLEISLKKNYKIYLCSWFGIAGLILIGTAVYFLLFSNHLDLNFGMLTAAYQAAGMEVTSEQAAQTVLIQLVMGVILSPFMNILNCFGEEWGWRGYLLPMMLKKFKVVPALLISGVIWGLWHAPLTVMGHNYGLNYPGYPVVGILAMCIFCIVTGIIFSYLCIKANSCIPAVIAHGTLNGFAQIGSLFLAADAEINPFIGPLPIGIVGGIGLIGAAVLCVMKLVQEEKHREAASL